MLKNLLSHLDSDAQMMAVQDYVPGTLNGFDATFYLGAYYDNQIPKAVLADMAASTKTVVWFKYNLWQFAWDEQYGFAQKYGFSFAGLRGLNAEPTAANPTPGFFDTVTYKKLPFVKYYTYDDALGRVNADPDIGVARIDDALKAKTIVGITNPTTKETAPYILRSGNFWYVADLPFSYIGPRDRYLVLADVLHDMMGVSHPENHRAMVRLEDVGAMVSVQAMKTLSDYLWSKKIPYSIAVIPKYVDSLGIYNEGVAQTVLLRKASNLKKALNYSLARGGEIVMHGYTHQYGEVKNANSGVSGDDYEFWDIVANAPVAWEAPHYQASALASKATPQSFATTYQRVVYYTADKPDFGASLSKDFSVGQVYPYVIKKDYYGQRVLPENIGNIEYDIRAVDPNSNFNYTWKDLEINARYAYAVRDGFASFFFHPFWLEPTIGTPGFKDFKLLVESITRQGYVWTSPSRVKD